MIISANRDNDIKIIPIKTPILPFRLGNARVIDTKHTFLHYIEINALFNQLDSIENSYNVLEKSIIQSSSKTLQNTHFINPNNLLNNAKYLISQIKVKLNNLNPNNRPKRGLINVGGKITKWLFGTLDSDDGKKYTKAINELHNNQNSHKREINLQISLTKQLIDNYNNTVTLLAKNQEHIKNHINIFESNLNQSAMDVTTVLKVQNTLLQIILNCQFYYIS